jgi:putative sigma-54 modulation protein
MQINLVGHNVEITSALRAFTEDKLNKLERHFDKITSIHVVFDVEKLRQIAEASILVSKSKLHARAESEDMYVTVNMLVDKLDRQLIEHKEKTHKHRE